MGKLFGTDGIRGIVNQDLTGEMAYRVGMAAAQVLSRETAQKPRFFIGMDTRISGTMLEAALTAGLTAAGASVRLLGVVPTPAVAFVTKHFGYDAGIMVSASHNPFEHNGIKIFNHKGFKLSDSLEEEIEALVLREKQEAPLPIGSGLGGVKHTDGSELNVYLDHLTASVDHMPSMKLLIDCANGSASATAETLFRRFPNLNCDFLAVQPDGKNINDHCGSTYLSTLAEKVTAGGYDLGIAFDGDADRCLCVDETGEEIDGDQMMAACAQALMEEGRLPDHMVVATVMSNIGLHRYCKENQLNLVCTAVGDRNVLEVMIAHGYAIGGEQSGHMIFLEHATTGDGQLTALQFLKILGKSGMSASTLAGRCRKYPQILKNLVVNSKEDKERIMQSEALQEKCAASEAILADRGRILIRPSGTEPLIRVMAEAETQEQAQTIVDDLVNFIQSL